MSPKKEWEIVAKVFAKEIAKLYDEIAVLRLGINAIRKNLGIEEKEFWMGLYAATEEQKPDIMDRLMRGLKEKREKKE